MKKFLLFLMVFLGLFLLQGVIANAQEVEDTEYTFKWGEELRPEMEFMISSRYNVSIPEDKIKYHIDQLALEYMILNHIITGTDRFVFINMHCADRVWCDLYPSMILYYDYDVSDVATEVDEIATKIDYLDGLVDLYNNPDKWEGINFRFNVWWYSLGPNYSKYIYIFNNINRETLRLNNIIKRYNRDYDAEYPLVPYLDKMYTNYTYKECKDYYQHSIIEGFNTWYELSEMYPQGKELQYD